MTAAPGQNLGHYRLTEVVGEGGMGVVWKAIDTNLDREVAIKLLPAEIAQNPDRLKRFEAEARTTGGLNHPNIVAIFDLGWHEDAPYLVMELVPGETLRERAQELEECEMKAAAMMAAIDSSVKAWTAAYPSSFDITSFKDEMQSLAIGRSAVTSVELAKEMERKMLAVTNRIGDPADEEAEKIILDDIDAMPPIVGTVDAFI